MLMRLMSIFAFVLACAQAFAAEPSAAGVDAEADPFAEVSPRAAPEAEQAPQSATGRFFSDNFGFRKELMSEFGSTGAGHSASRQSAGFETIKKFSTDTKTFAGVDFQARVVRRDGFVGSQNDFEGMHRKGWKFEYHNAYADFYNVLDPVFTEQGQSANVGRFNARLGRFYVPFGLNLQTDTHGTVFQLSNERNFGFERDWYAGFWGILSEDLRYDVYYLAGSGYDLKFKGQGGLGAARIGLTNKYSSEYGLEGGLSLIGGERLDPEAEARSPAVLADAGSAHRVNTLRAGLDGRYRKDVPTGLLTWTSEVSAGRDKPDDVFTQLHQLDYLHASRRWGLAAQYRWFRQDMARDRQLTPLRALGNTDSSISAEASWYFRNDVGGSNLHWIKLVRENQLERQEGDKNAIWTLQYYRYW